MADIPASIDPRKEFSECLRDIMEQKQVFQPATHTYLVNVMMHYVDWHERDTLDDKNPGRQESKETFDALSPTIHTDDVRPFAFQTAGIGEKLGYLTNTTLWAERLRAIADTLLVAVGYWPESIARRPGRKERRPSISYYAKMGQSTYAQAADIMYTRDNLRPSARIMHGLAEGFREYAGVLYHFRHDLGDIPVKNIDLVLEMTRLLKDQSILDRYTLKLTSEEIQAQKKIKN